MFENSFPNSQASSIYQWFISIANPKFLNGIEQCKCQSVALEEEPEFGSMGAAV